MLRRYTRQAMWEHWSEEHKLFTWNEVELAFIRARGEMGQLDKAAYDAIEPHKQIDLELMTALESEFHHDMIAFVVMRQRILRANGAEQWADEYHKLLTSYDVEDPAMVLLLRKAVEMDIEALQGLEAALREKAQEHKWTLMIARTHGQSAEPDTFGHLLLVFAEAIWRSIQRLKFVLDQELSEGKISGAVGNFPAISPAMTSRALQYLGLSQARAETQILQRDRFAAVLAAIAVAGASIEQVCRTFWEMMRSDVSELQEPRGQKQRGSSRMAYKRNPIKTEQLQGLARLLRGHAHTAMENVATPDCRDISQSSVERHILPESTALLDYMAFQLTKIVGGLVVSPERMKLNLERTQGVWAAQPVRDALMAAGVPYDPAYDYLQRVGFKATDEARPMLDLLVAEPISEQDQRTAGSILGGERLCRLFDPVTYIRDGIEHLFSDELNKQRKHAVYSL